MGAGRRCLGVHLRSHAVDSWAVVFVRGRLSSFISVHIIIVPSIWLVTWRCHVVVIVGVIKQLREVAVETKQTLADDGGGREEQRLFADDVLVSSWQTPLTRLSINRRWSLSHNITNLSHHAPFIY